MSSATEEIIGRVVRIVECSTGDRGPETISATQICIGYKHDATKAYARRNSRRMAVRRLATHRSRTIAVTHEGCRCYKCDTIDSFLGDIAHYGDLNKRELAEAIRGKRTHRRKRMRHPPANA